MLRYFSVLLFLLPALGSFAQDVVPQTQEAANIMFYNCENLFDTEDDPDKWDEEFLPDTAKYWTPYRYNQKLFHIYQVITAVGGWDAPDVVGVCEVENRKVLEDLISKTPLYNAGYEIIHHESPDGRGIDVGMLYRKNHFEPLMDYPIPVTFKGNNRATRDILYVKGKISTGDTVHLFVNHWPSRWGGQMATEPKRVRAASILRHHVDSLFQKHENPEIIIMGDLNDYPDNKSVTETLRAQNQNFNKPRPEVLYNLSWYLQEEKGQGSHKYHGEWGVLDQIIVSGSLLDDQSPLYTRMENVNVFMGDFLLEKDEKNVGEQPYRTYLGYKYHGGFSDHLPVYIKLFRNKE
ncbi:MAG TPA: endonuclease/exonuclease/phosphatase family protein [Bacteroidales bacterium]|nr:endonuclease/exonuclease/phosphatase family protein [Bacteroidales bacterium]